ncbi:MAG: type I-D CRISPR-associated helicase Cas3' [bacterium]
MTLNIKVLPIDYIQEDFDWLEGKRPYGHQRQVFELTWKAVEDKEFVCIFNTSATGGGKTLASFAYPIKNGVPVVGIYPTNELIDDQYRALSPEYERYSGADTISKVDSRELDRWEFELETKGHSQALETVLGWRGAVLTNPDIVYLTFFGYYNPERKPGQNERLFNKIAEYTIYIFDEFHLYNVKQMGNVATMIGTLHALQKNRAKVFIFSSATPNPRFLEILRKLGIKTEEVVAEEYGGEDPNARRVAYPVDLTILPADLTAWQAFATLQENFGIVQDFLDSYRSAKSVFILDSVADAVQLSNLLRDRVGDGSVGEVHGLSSEESRRKALLCDHTVGTSTIEVGIDFKGEAEKDLLVFEAKTSAQFIQRFGRIGRHQKSTTIPNKAIAVVPLYVYNFLRERIGDTKEITRTRLYCLVNEGYQDVNQFDGYFKRYTPVEAFALSKFIAHQMQPDVRDAVKESVEQVIAVMSDREIDKIARSYAWLSGNSLLKPLQSFRGGGFDAAIIDGTETVGNPLKVYDLFFVLRRGKFKELPAKEFFDRVDELETKFPEIQLVRKRLGLIDPEIESLLGIYDYFRLDEVLNSARKVWFEVPFDRIQKTEDISTIKGLSIKTEPRCDLRWLNETLRRKTFVCWIGKHNPWIIKLSKALPPLFEIYELHVCQNLRIYKWSIAFNQSAYFLSCLSWKDRDFRGDSSDA